jgi:hypothetical protein
MQRAGHKITGDLESTVFLLDLLPGLVKLHRMSTLGFTSLRRPCPLIPKPTL